jgi:phosphatidylserine decarboxylase
VFDVNRGDLERPLSHYRTLKDFFTRKLKEGARQVKQEEGEVVSPVDAQIVSAGSITRDREFLVKGRKYSIERMLKDEKLVSRYDGGSFVVLYLSPKDYHRIHSPISGVVSEHRIIGKQSYPVNKWGLKYGKDPLSENYRIITEIVSDDNEHIALVKVGAMFINSIEITHENERIEKGEELAYFSFGSTVILLFERNQFMFRDKENLIQKHVLVGEPIGYFN